MSLHWNLRTLFRRRRFDDELDEEVAFHLELREQQLIDQGFTPQAARLEARKRFGNQTLALEDSRAHWGFRRLEELVGDVGYAVRSLTSRRSSAGLTIATLALGIGVATAVFSIVNGVLFQPLPYPDADRLVMGWAVNPEKGFGLLQQRNASHSMSIPEFLDWQNDSGVFENVIGFNEFFGTLSGTDDPEPISGYGTTPGLFQVLGVQPLFGRGFLPEEEQPGGERVVVLMYDFWRRRFGANPAVIGSQIESNGRRARIVGVMPPEFVFFSRRIDLLRPTPLESGWLQTRRTQRFFQVMGRIRKGVTLKQAQAQADLFSERLAQQHPESNDGWSVKLIPVSEESAGHLWPAMKVLFGAVSLLLLITCFNIANLRLVQTSARRRELALRSALGAGRWRLLRLMLIESLALGLVGGPIGFAIAWAMIQHFQTLLPDPEGFGRYLLQAEAVEMNPWVIGFSLATALGSALFFGFVSAWRASKPDLIEGLNEASKGSVGGRKGRAIRDFLVVCEVAMAVVMVTGAGLLVRSFVKLYEQGPGIRYDKTLTVVVGIPFGDVRQQAQEEQLGSRESLELFQSAFRSRRDLILNEVAKQPGVESVATGNLPLTALYSLNEFYVESRVGEFADDTPGAVFRTISSNYTDLLRIPLEAGRMFDERDHLDAPLVAVVSRELARRYFADQDPIGQRIGLGAPSAGSAASSLYTVIGVVGDVHADGMNRPPPPILYTPILQSSSPTLTLLVRADGEPMALLPQLRAAVRRAAPGASVGQARTLDAIVRDSVYEVHYSMLLLGGLALLALTLAVVGVYGVLSFSVRERTREIGVRMSLGAERSQVLGQVVRDGVKLVAIGIVAGLLGAAGLTRFLSTLIFGVEPLDLATFAGVASLLLFAGLLASYLPARRAADVNPMNALRSE